MSVGGLSFFEGLQFFFRRDTVTGAGGLLCLHRGLLARSLARLIRQIHAECDSSGGAVILESIQVPAEDLTS